jgi:hypothetical protein
MMQTQDANTGCEHMHCVRNEKRQKKKRKTAERLQAQQGQVSIFAGVATRLACLAPRVPIIDGPVAGDRRHQTTSATTRYRLSDASHSPQVTDR